MADPDRERTEAGTQAGTQAGTESATVLRTGTFTGTGPQARTDPVGQGEPFGPELPDIAAIREARERIHPSILRTPLIPAPWLGEPIGSSVDLKAESLQLGGAFKIRGALNAILRAVSRGEVPEAGVITYSSGNHGQAVAIAARMLGLRATVVAPSDVRAVKQRAMESLGAVVVTSGLTTDDRHREALRIGSETGARVIPPYDHPDVIAGQGTVALEVLEASRDLDDILVPVGGGGLLAGIAIAVKSLRPAVRVIGVEPERANDFQLSLREGRIVSIPAPDTIADGLRALCPGDLTFRAARRFVDAILTVTERGIRTAQIHVLERSRLLVEPSGAVAVAACMEAAEALRGRHVAVVLSGGNTTLEEVCGIRASGGSE